MTTRILAPSLGDRVNECTVARWHVPSGSAISRGDLLVTLETRKAINEIEAEHTGLLTHSVREGATIPIGSEVGVIDHDGLATIDGVPVLSLSLSDSDLRLIDDFRGTVPRDQFVLGSLRERLAQPQR